MNWILVLALALADRARAQKIDSLGTAGGSGPTGGIGDSNNPVTKAQCFVTDAKIPDYSNVGGTRQLASCDAPSSSGSSGGKTVTIDSKNGARQELIGFGHAWTDSAIEVFSTLSDDTLDKLMDELFGQDGNNMGFMRHTIGSSDMSQYMYSYDESSDDDTSLSKFNLGNGTAMAKMIAKAGSKKSDITLLGSPWSAPGWMKNNNAFVCENNNNCGQDQNSLDESNFDALASYFGKYVDAFKDLGVTINAVTPQNEPLNTQGGYPTMYMSADSETNFINKALGKAMKDKGVQVWAYDHNTDNTDYPNQVVSGAGDVTGAAWHCYQEPYPDYSVLSDMHKSHPDLLQVMSECITYLPKTGDYNYQVPINFMLPLQNYAAGGTMWVMATNPDYGPHTQDGGCAGCKGSIVVNSDGTYTKTQDYYMVGQFSRFIRRGAVYYDVTEGNEGSLSQESSQFFVISVKNPDGSWAVVFMNNLDDDQDVNINFTGGEQSWSGTVPAKTVMTWLLPGDGSWSSSSSSAPASSSTDGGLLGGLTLAASSGASTSAPASAAPASSAPASSAPASAPASSAPASAPASSAASAPASASAPGSAPTSAAPPASAPTSGAPPASAATSGADTSGVPLTQRDTDADTTTGSGSVVTSPATASGTTSTSCPPTPPRMRTVTRTVTI